MSDAPVLDAPVEVSAGATIVFSRVPRTENQGQAAASDGAPFCPPEPKSLAETGLSAMDVEPLILKQLLISGTVTGRKIAEQIKLPFGVTQDLLRGLKQQSLVNFTCQVSMGDYEHELTEEGETRARWQIERCTYCGSAPVPLAEYVRSVESQSVRFLRPRLGELCAAFQDLSLSPATISQIGQAIFSGRGMLLFGNSGNGKTSIAQRVMRAVTQTIWIPRAVTITGEIIRVFDPTSHEEAPHEDTSHFLERTHFDRRWVRIKRPSIVVGGELRLEQLEFTTNSATGIIESPVHLKANGGVLVVDDVGRQRVSTTDLLNRWIVPLEKGNDFLSLPSGRQIQVPFDPIMIFSTNVEPAKLADEAFQRRIPYKIKVSDPSPSEFRELTRSWCGKLGVEYHDEACEYLLTQHYGQGSRPLRYCHPRDLVQLAKTYCEFNELPLVLTTKALDAAVKNYFAE